MHALILQLIKLLRTIFSASPFLGLLPTDSPVPVELIVAGSFSFSYSNSSFFTHCNHSIIFSVVMYCLIRNYSSHWPFKCFINVIWIHAFVFTVLLSLVLMKGREAFEPFRLETVLETPS